MHDTARCEAQGQPSVAVLSTAFKPQAKFQAEMLGARDLPVVFVDHPISDQTAASLSSKADSAMLAIVKALIDTPVEANSRKREAKSIGNSSKVPDAECGT